MNMYRKMVQQNYFICRTCDKDFYVISRGTFQKNSDIYYKPDYIPYPQINLIKIYFSILNFYTYVCVPLLLI